MARSPNEPVARRKRRARTYDAGSGRDLGALYDITATSNPDIVKQVVPNDTPIPDDGSVVAVARDMPEPGQSTWYQPTASARAAGKLTALMDTIAATGAQLTDAGRRALDVGGAIIGNLQPILIGVALLYVWLQWEKMK